MGQQNDVNIKIQVDTTQAQSSTDNYKKRLKELKDQMTQLQIETDGLSKASAEQRQRFSELSQEAGKIQDAMSDTAQQVKNLSDDYMGMTAALQGVQAGVGAITAVSGALTAFGVENEKANEAIKKMTSLMGILQGVQAVSKALNKDSALMTALRAKSEKSLNKELAKTTQAETAGTAATATFTAAEGAATTGAITLKGAIKAVGTAIKSIPVVGWILAAIAAITTLISLISSANDEEERGVEIRREQIKLIDEQQSKLRKVYTAVSEEEKHFKDISDRLKVVKKDSAEWEDIMSEVSSTTRISKDYLADHPAIVERVLDQQHKLNKAQQEYNTYQELIQEHEEEAQKARDEWLHGHDEKEKESARVRYYMLDDLAKSEKRLAANADADIQKYKQSLYQYIDISNNWKRVQEGNEEAANRASEAQKKYRENYRKSVDEQIKWRNEARLAELKMDVDASVEGTEARLEAERAYLREQERQEKEALKIRLLNAEISEKDKLAIISELNAKWRNKETELDAKYQQTLADNRRKEVDTVLNTETAKLKAQLAMLDKNTKAYYDKKQDIDRANELKELEELKRRYEDDEIVFAEYEATKDAIVAEHAQARAEILNDYANAVAEHQRQLDEEERERNEYKWQNAQNLVNAYSNLVNTAMEAELEAVGDNAAEQKRIRKKYAKSQFVAQIADIAVSTGQAIMGAWASASKLAFPYNLLVGGMMTLMLGATGGAQIAQAHQQMDTAMQAERGGILGGQSHANGGTMLSNGVEAERGEAVINKRSTAMFAPLLSEINSYNGYGAPLIKSNRSGDSALAGGVSDETIQKIVSATVAGVTSIPVVVSEHNITEAQRNVGITRERSVL